MRFEPQTLLSPWHNQLHLSRHTRAWYRQRLKEELHERHIEKARLRRLSESADVFCILTRAQADGHPLRRLPIFRCSHIPVHLYMVLKYTLRWSFYRMAARLTTARDSSSVRDVVNPRKDSKVSEVADRHGLDQHKFIRVCRRLRWVWPLLP
ncbi:hypothetical protein CC79DRAFT_1343568 [Sarocladium strictum]